MTQETKTLTQHNLHRLYGNAVARPEPTPQGKYGQNGTYIAGRGIPIERTPEEKAQRAREQAERDAEARKREERERAEMALAEYRKERYEAWRQAGGDAQSFEAVWPTLQQDFLLKKIRA